VPICEPVQRAARSAGSEARIRVKRPRPALIPYPLPSMLLLSIPSSSRFIVERWAGISDGWLPETEPLTRQKAEARLRLRQAVRGDLWRYRVAPLQINFVG